MTLPEVIFKAPRAGLANMLISWARAVVFAEQNQLTLGSYGWSAFRPGPWLRREARKRLYQNMFRSSMSWSQILTAEFRIRTNRNICFEPKGTDTNSSIYVFRAFPKGPDFFRGLQTHSLLIRDRFQNLILPEVHRQVESQPRVRVACHVRRGDFIAPGNPKYSVGGKYCQTPTSYYCDAIHAIRSFAAEPLPVTVFTDGRPDEIQELLNLPAVELATKNTDVVDLVRMSRSEFLLTSAWSSYSYLAGYLGDSTLIRFSYPEMQPVRDDTSSGAETTLDRLLQLPTQGRAA